MKRLTYFVLFFFIALTIFLCFRFSKKEMLRRSVETYNRRVKEYREQDSINKLNSNSKLRGDTVVTYPR